MRRVPLLSLCAPLLSGSYSIQRWSPGPEARQQSFRRDYYECIRQTSQRGRAEQANPACVTRSKTSTAR
jgi:hypothetical protein